jgi:hypothetical protein
MQILELILIYELLLKYEYFCREARQRIGMVRELMCPSGLDNLFIGNRNCHRSMNDRLLMSRRVKLIQYYCSSQFDRLFQRIHDGLPVPLCAGLL